MKIRSLLNLLDLSIARLQFNKEKFFSFEKNGSFVNITAFGNAMLVSKTNLCKKNICVRQFYNKFQYNKDYAILN